MNGAAKCPVTLNAGRSLRVFKPCPTTNDITICGSIHTPSSIIGLRGVERRGGEGVKGAWGERNKGGEESCGRKTRVREEGGGERAVGLHRRKVDYFYVQGRGWEVAGKRRGEQVKEKVGKKGEIV